MWIQNQNKKEKVNLQRRRFLACGVSAMIHLSLPISPVAASKRPVPLGEVSSLQELLKHNPSNEPMLMLRDFATDPDDEIKAMIMKDLANRSELLARVKEKIHFDKKMTLSIDKLQIRLLYAPERREDFKHAYGTYCHQAIAFLFEKMGGNNFYRSITWPHTAKPEIPTGEGVSAFLVHRLAKEYIAECTFGAEDGRTVRYRLKGAILSDHLGAVDLEIESPKEGQFQIHRKNYSVWQNNTQNLYTLLEIPLEETLHFIIGKHTDQIIKETLMTKRYRQVFEVRNLADHWMAMEEALVGGLVRQVLKEYAEQHRLNLEPALMDRSLVAKKGLSQYRYREAGIRLVDRLGYFESVELYRRDQVAFQRHLELA